MSWFPQELEVKKQQVQYACLHSLCFPWVAPRTITSLTLVCLSVQQTARYFDTEVRTACIVDHAALQKWQQQHCCDCNKPAAHCQCKWRTGILQCCMSCFVISLHVWPGWLLPILQVSLQQDNSFRAVRQTCCLDCTSKQKCQNGLWISVSSRATFSNKFQHTQQSMQQHAQAHATASTSPYNSKQWSIANVVAHTACMHRVQMHAAAKSRSHAAATINLSSCL